MVRVRVNSSIYFLWERHTEASTITLIFAHDVTDAERAPYIRWLEQWPGAVVRATRVFVFPDNTNIDAELKRHDILQDEMVCCDVNAGVRIWSDFGIHEDGYGRLLVSAGQVGDGERGRIVQRLQELGNYRNSPSSGLPLPTSTKRDG